jgi:hypothetical protein
MDRLTDQPARTWPPSSQEDSRIVSGACVWSSGVSDAASKVKVNCCLETRTCTVGRCLRSGAPPQSAQRQRASLTGVVPQYRRRRRRSRPLLWVCAGGDQICGDADRHRILCAEFLGTGLGEECARRAALVQAPPNEQSSRLSESGGLRRTSARHHHHGLAEPHCRDRKLGCLRGGFGGVRSRLRRADGGVRLRPERPLRARCHLDHQPGNLFGFHGHGDHRQRWKRQRHRPRRFLCSRVSSGDRPGGSGDRPDRIDDVHDRTTGSDPLSADQALVC